MTHQPLAIAYLSDSQFHLKTCERLYADKQFRPWKNALSCSGRDALKRQVWQGLTGTAAQVPY